MEACPLFHAGLGSASRAEAVGEAHRAAAQPASRMQAGEQKLLVFSWILEFDWGRAGENTSTLALQEMYLRQHLMSSIILTGAP